LAGGRGGNRTRLDEGVVGHLRIDRDRLTTREQDHHVGTARAALGGDRRLHAEVDAVEQARRLDEGAQLGLAPDPARGVVAQGARELFRRLAQALLRLARRLELLGELAVLLRALRLALDDLAVPRAERLLDGRALLQDPVLRGRR